MHTLLTICDVWQCTVFHIHVCGLRCHVHILYDALHWFKCGSNILDVSSVRVREFVSTPTHPMKQIQGYLVFPLYAFTRDLWEWCCTVWLSWQVLNLVGHSQTLLFGVNDLSRSHIGVLQHTSVHVTFDRVHVAIWDHTKQTSASADKKSLCRI